jgi:hypothetical protein
MWGVIIGERRNLEEGTAEESWLPVNPLSLSADARPTTDVSVELTFAAADAATTLPQSPRPLSPLTSSHRPAMVQSTDTSYVPVCDTVVKHHS